MINTDSNTVIKYRKSISTPINKGDKIRLFSFMFQYLRHGWVPDVFLDCIVSGRDELYLYCMTHDNRRKLHRVFNINLKKRSCF